MSSSSISITNDEGQQTTQQVPQIQKQLLPDVLNGSEHNLDTYWGRVRHFANVTDMRTLFVTDARLRQATEKIDEYERFRTGKMSADEEQKYVSSWPKITGATTADKKSTATAATATTATQGTQAQGALALLVKEMWEHKKVKDSVLHPDLGEKILLPFRMSAFVPMNVAIVAGMLGARSIASTTLWQTVNQTFNVCVNHSNRNASNTMSNSQLLTNYLAAVTSSVGTAVGLNEWVKRSNYAEHVKQNLLRVVPFTAVTIANIFNIGLMRRQEMTSGITVKDHEGNDRGKSAVAGRTAVAQTIFSRVILVMPTMVFQPMLMSACERTTLFKKYPVLTPTTNLLSIAVMIAVCLPLCIGMFPQISSMEVEKMEPTFHNLVDSKGNKVEKLYYNKGL